MPAHRLGNQRIELEPVGRLDDVEKLVEPVGPEQVAVDHRTAPVRRARDEPRLRHAAGEERPLRLERRDVGQLGMLGDHIVGHEPALEHRLGVGDARLPHHLAARRRRSRSRRSAPIQSSGATAGWPVEPIDEPVAAMSPGTTVTVQPKLSRSSRAWISARISADGHCIRAIVTGWVPQSGRRRRELDDRGRPAPRPGTESARVAMSAIARRRSIR